MLLHKLVWCITDVCACVLRACVLACVPLCVSLCLCVCLCVRVHLYLINTYYINDAVIAATADNAANATGHTFFLYLHNIILQHHILTTYTVTIMIIVFVLGWRSQIELIKVMHTFIFFFRCIRCNWPIRYVPCFRNGLQQLMCIFANVLLQL